MAPERISTLSSPCRKSRIVSLRSEARNWNVSALPLPFSVLRAAGTTPKVAARVKGFELQRAFVANGLGVAVTYTQPAAEMPYDGRPLKAVRVADDLPPQKVLLIRRQRKPLRPIVARAEEVILTALRQD